MIIKTHNLILYVLIHTTKIVLKPLLLGQAGLRVGIDALVYENKGFITC